ncbi:MAG: YggT family protein [Spirochaetota bacterium]
MLIAVIKLLSGIISVYILLLIIRIMLSWFQSNYLGKPYEILVRLTDPYLNIFRRIRFLRTARFDFSPIAALLVLGVLQNIAVTLAITGVITLGIILALIIGAVWSTISFLLILFLIIIVIRFIGLLLKASTVSPFWHALDVLLEPIVYRVSRIVPPKYGSNYPLGLAMLGLAVLIVNFLGRIIINLIMVLFRSLPF